MCSNMGKYVAIISDLDGKASVLRRLKSSIPHGSTVIYDGDIHGEPDRTFNEKIGRQVKHDAVGYYAELHRQSREQTPEYMQWQRNSYYTTKDTLNEIIESTLWSDPILVTGNREVYQSDLWNYDSGMESPSDIFRNSSIPYVENLPILKSYKNGRETKDERNADTAVVIVPYVRSKSLDEKLSMAKGIEPTGTDAEKSAIYELIRDDGIVDRIKSIDPKNIFVVMHENPSPELFAPFGKPYESDNKNLYSVLASEMSAIKNSGKSRATRLLFIYGHIGPDKGKFYRTVNLDGNNIDTLHMKEGEEFLIIDTESGEIVDAGTVGYDANAAFAEIESDRDGQAVHGLEAVIAGAEGASGDSGSAE